MSWGHVTATHHRSGYADPESCLFCREQYEARTGISYDRVVQRQWELLSSALSLGALILGLFFALRAVLWLGERLLTLAL